MSEYPYDLKRKGGERWAGGEWVAGREEVRTVGSPKSTSRWRQLSQSLRGQDLLVEVDIYYPN